MRAIFRRLTRNEGALPSYLIAPRSAAKRKKKPTTGVKRTHSFAPTLLSQAREAGRPSGLCDYVSAYYAERVFNAGPFFLYNWTSTRFCSCLGVFASVGPATSEKENP